MNKLKVVVYAISKNEEKFINRWYNSVKEADQVYVLDTGSKDNTVELLKKKGVIVKQEIIKPWRFDVARNKSLEMVDNDADICVCIDLDEVLSKGWRKKLEKYWIKNTTTRARYNYNWSLDKDNNPLVNFYLDNIHSRDNYKWVNPVHEVLTCKDDKKENIITIDSIILNHYPDINKSRKSYLPLLELSVKENPNNDRNMHYLGREYMYYGKWKKAIATLKKHLKMPNATWKDERCASMRFISRCYQNLNMYDKAKEWLINAIDEAPYLRDPYMEMALLKFRLDNYKDAEKYCLKALRIPTHSKTYINEVFSWDNTVYDLLSVCCYYLNKIDYAIYFIDVALSYDKDNERLIENKKIFLQKEGKM